MNVNFTSLRKKIARREKLSYEELKVKTGNDETLAHVVARKNFHGEIPLIYLVKDKQTFVKVLTLSTKDGWSVAHELANQGFYFPRNEKVDEILLNARTKRGGYTPLHVLASNHPSVFVKLFRPSEREFYTVPADDGTTPAHVLASRKIFPFTEKDKDVLLLPAGLNGPTVLEVAVLKGTIRNVKDPELQDTMLSIGLSVRQYLRIVLQ